MPLTNFPNGISSFGVPIYSGAGGNMPLFLGNVFFVSSTMGANGNGGTSAAFPFATVVFALTQAVASNGDVIIVMPGHVETISDATTFALSKAGVSILGQGNGNARPTFTLDTANTATIPVSAANIAIDNCIFTANFLSIAACFTLSTAVAFKVTNCAFKETSNVLNFLNIVKSTGAANTIDSLVFTDNNWNGKGTTSVNSVILTANDIDSAVIQRNDIKLAKSADTSILLTVTAGVLTNLDCGYNRVYSAQTATTAGSLINVGGTTSTGFVYNNYAQTLTTTADKLFTVTVGLAAFDNKVTGAVGASGFLIPAVDS